MIDATSKALFHSLAQIDLLKRLASRYGMRPGGFARRFIAGETVEEAIVAVAELPARGLSLTLDYLGESSTTFDEAAAAAGEYVRIIGAIVRSGIERNISVKLTQLGLDVDRATAVDNMRRILEPADQHGFFVRVDMENSPYTDRTLQVMETLWRQGHRGIGTVIQSCLIRSPKDVGALNALGMRVRLVKGAYKEPASVAWQKKEDVDASFLSLMRLLLEHGSYPAIATHDPAMIEQTRRYAGERSIARDRFEFQMLFGIRRDLQTALRAEDYGMRIYVPFGQQWFPYFMRRLGERPANVAFVLKSIFREG